MYRGEFSNASMRENSGFHAHLKSSAFTEENAGANPRIANRRKSDLVVKSDH